MGKKGIILGILVLILAISFYNFSNTSNTPNQGESERTVRHTIETWTGEFGGSATYEITLYSENTGGSGTFYYLVAQNSDNAVLPVLGPVLIGDRIEFKEGRVEDDPQGGSLVIDYVGHAEDDPLCCPTQEKSIRVSIPGNSIVITEI